ncbi:hypothetical protein MTO96_024450 [Rhipicephalus appendiculatus]
MAGPLVAALLLVLSASAVHGSESPDDTATLLQAVATMQDTVAYFSSVDDPSEKCMTAERPVFVPDEDKAVFTFHYQSPDGNYKVDYCVNITASESGNFPFGPCGDTELGGTAQMLFFDGHSCFGGHISSLRHSTMYHVGKGRLQGFCVGRVPAIL